MIKRLSFLLLSFFAVPVFAVTYPVSVPGVSVAADGGLVYTSRLGIPSMVYPQLASSAPLNIPIAGVPPRNQLVTVPFTVSPNTTRAALAVMTLARVAGPIGMGINLVQLVCSTTDICTSTANPDVLVLKKQSTVPPSQGCYAASGGYYGCDAIDAERPGLLIWWRNGTVVPIPSICNLYKNASWNYTASGYICTEPLLESPPTPADYDAAVIKLAGSVNRLAELVQHMQDKGLPVPVDKPVLSPASATSEPLTTTNRDALGNTTSSTTTTTTTNTYSDIDNSVTNNVTVTQSTTTITNNASGAPVSSTTTSTPVAALPVSAAPIPVTLPTEFKFPDDYNREVTQKQMQSEAKTYQDGVKADREAATTAATTLDAALKAPPPPLPPPADVSGWGFPKLELFQGFSLGLGDKMPSGTACTPIPLTVLGQVVAVDVCPVVAAVKPMINWSIIILGAFAGLLVFLKPEEAAA